ncbi:MAG: VOC family protein [Deltaproteobacteria bacterium]|nr:VOC family protein [Deltaproteobacteria bacterium]
MPADFTLAYVRVFVRDFDRAVSFYTDALGMKLAQRSDEFGWAELATGDAKLALERVAPSDAEGEALVGRFVGVSLAVADVEATYARLRERGVAFEAPPEHMPWGGVLAHFRDPDGNVLTLVSAASSR